MLHSVVEWLYSWAWPPLVLSHAPRAGGPEDVPFDMDAEYTDEKVLDSIGRDMLGTVNDTLALDEETKEACREDVYTWAWNMSLFVRYDPSTGFAPPEEGRE